MNIYLVMESFHEKYPDEEHFTTSICGGFYNLNNAEILLKEEESSNSFDSGKDYWIEEIVVTDKPPF